MSSQHTRPTGCSRRSMFTDLVASTEHTARVGDRRWTELLAAHDAAVRAELDRWRGREIKSTGDGMLATFDGPGRALRCAAAIRDSVRSLGFELRIGLHTGEIEQRGDDIAGIAVVIAKRVEATAPPGARSSSRGPSLTWSPGSGIEFTDYGVHELKGVPTAGTSSSRPEPRSHGTGSAEKSA